MWCRSRNCGSVRIPTTTITISKLRHAKKFLEEGSKVKATVQFRGRDIVYSQNGTQLLGRFADDLKELGKVEQQALLEGKRMSIIVAPK